MRKALRWIAALALPAAGLAVVTPEAEAVQTEPNVILILVDDGRLDDMPAMPAATDRIGAQGATFENAYAPFALCCPDRATLLTGQFAHNHGVISNQAPSGGFTKFKDASTLATWLTPTYHTALVGKYLNEYEAPYIPPGWDEFYKSKADYTYTYDKWLAYNGLFTAVRTIPGYSVDTVGNLSADFVRRSAPSDEPYFLYAAPVAPHVGTPADPDDPAGFPTPYVKPVYRNAYAGLRTQTQAQNPAYNEADVSDKPIKPSPLSTSEQAALTETYQQRWESQKSVNDATNAILDAVDASGESADTIVFFMSDNGLLLGEHRIRGGKIAPYEPSNHLPWLMRWPGHITPGTKVSQVVSHADFASTVADAANVTPGLVQDGRSLLPEVTGTPTPHHPVPLEGADASTGTWIWRGVITQDRWKYIERVSGAKELYDLNTDPYELQNRAKDPAYAAKMDSMAVKLARYRDCAGSTC